MFLLVFVCPQRGGVPQNALGQGGVYPSMHLARGWTWRMCENRGVWQRGVHPPPPPQDRPQTRSVHILLECIVINGTLTQYLGKLTAHKEVHISWEARLGLHQLPRVTRMEHVVNTVSVHADWARGWKKNIIYYFNKINYPGYWSLIPYFWISGNVYSWLS